MDISQIENSIIRKLIEILISAEKVKPAEIISHFETSEEREIISKLLIEDDQTTDFIQLAKDCLLTLSKISIIEKIKKLRLKIRKMESTDENTSKLMKKIVIIGSGIVGICTAVELINRGFSVTLIDPNEPGSQTSYGNAGVLTDSLASSVSSI